MDLFLYFVRLSYHPFPWVIFDKRIHSQVENWIFRKTGTPLDSDKEATQIGLSDHPLRPSNGVSAPICLRLLEPSSALTRSSSTEGPVPPPDHAAVRRGPLVLGPCTLIRHLP
jgi:hypothetical protein